MITHIWLKSQPKKKISYPEMSPDIIKIQNVIYLVDDKENVQSQYVYTEVSRIEFRP